MEGLERTKLRTVEEAVRWADIHGFGNVAVVLAICEMTESSVEVHR